MPRILLTVILLIATSMPGGALGQPAISSEIAPLGKLRVGIQTGAPILATRARDGSISGVSADLGKFIAERLGISFEPVGYANEGAYAQSFGKGEWDEYELYLDDELPLPVASFG